jgi:hypothetical protein
MFSLRVFSVIGLHAQNAMTLSTDGLTSGSHDRRSWRVISALRQKLMTKAIMAN